MGQEPDLVSADYDGAATRQAAAARTSRRM